MQVFSWCFVGADGMYGCSGYWVAVVSRGFALAAAQRSGLGQLLGDVKMSVRFLLEVPWRGSLDSKTIRFEDLDQALILFLLPLYRVFLFSPTV
jgi:hypothetical protein